MDVRQLKALIAVADHGTFSAAADVLDTVQSNVSAHIARLEKELNTTLIDRGAGQLTDEGSAVTRRARRIVAELDSLTADVAAVHNEVVGEVQLGVIGTTARWIAPELFALAKTRHPLLRIVLKEATSQQLEPQLQSGLLDLAITLLPNATAEIAIEPLFEEDMLLVLPRDHPLAHNAMVDFPTAAKLPLLLPPSGSPLRNSLERAAMEHDVALNIKAQIDGVRLAASLVFDGFGTAILPATALPSYLEEHWSLVRVEGVLRRRVCLAHNRRSFPSAPARALRVLIGDAVANSIPLNPGLHLPMSNR